MSYDITKDELTHMAKGIKKKGYEIQQTVLQKPRIWKMKDN